MSSKPDGGPAFPCEIMTTLESGARERLHLPGMNLRDWFAGQAMTGMLLAKNKEALGLHVHICAEASYAVADAMIAERDKEENNAK